MNNTNKSRLLTTAILLLVAANIVALVMFWHDKNRKDAQMPPPPREQNGSAFDFLTKELALDSNQLKAYSVLRDEQRKSAEPLRKTVRETKDSLFSLLKQPNVSDADLQKYLSKVGAAQIELEKSTFQHFQNVRKLCTPKQQEKFDAIIQQAMQMFGQPNRRPPIDRPDQKDTSKRRPPRNRDNKDDELRPPPDDGPDGMPPHPPRDKDGKPMHPPRDGKGHPPPPPDGM
jgi:Spy/CpxP family protein refolding chaperone